MSIASLAGFVAAVSVLVVAAPLPAAAAPQSPGQVACIASLSKNAAKATKLHVKEASSCVKAVAAGKLGGCASAGDCVLADRKGKQAKTAAKLRDAERAACSGAEPEFGRRPGNLVLASVRGETLGLVDDLLGADLDAALLTKSVDAKGASCQGKVLGASSKMLLAMGAAYETCKMAGLASGSIEDAAGLGDCLGSIDADVKGKIGKAAAKVAKTVAGTCKSTDLAAAFPGSCAAAPDFAECVETRTRCRACRRGPIGDDVDADCDLFDDGATNGSCTGFAGRCHGRAELCDRAYDEVAHPTTHNAFTNAEEN